MPISFDTEEWSYFACPFPSTYVKWSPAARPAFKGSNVSLEINMHHLCAFATGALHKHAALLEISTEKGELRATPETNFEKVERKKKAIERRFNSWREILFYEWRYINHIFTALIRNSHVQAEIEAEFRPILDQIRCKGLFNDDADRETRHRREHYWEMARDCFNKCPSGLTRREMGETHNGYTVYESIMVVWWTLLGEDFTSTDFTQWKIQNYLRLEKQLDQLFTSCEKKTSCKSCRFTAFSTLQVDTIQFLFWYACNFRPNNGREFFPVFISALIFAFQRKELMHYLAEMYKAFKFGDGVTTELGVPLERFKYQVDDRRQEIAQVATDAMIDCLMVHHGALDQLPKPLA